MSLDPSKVEWSDWLAGELCSLPYDERAELLIVSIRHSNIASTLLAANLPMLSRFRLSEAMRDFADVLEQSCLRVRECEGA